MTRQEAIVLRDELRVEISRLFLLKNVPASVQSEVLTGMLARNVSRRWFDVEFPDDE